MNLRRLILLLALIWLALVLPHAGTRYSFAWDSSQFERAVEKFDVAAHQPQPPGYPLWVLALKGLTPIAGRANSAQVILALMFTIAGLLFFYSLAREMLGDTTGLAATALLGFSPLVLLHAITPLTYAVDLFAACSVGWMAARLWSGRTQWALLALPLTAITAGFRQSGATFLSPLLLVALCRSWRSRPRRATLGVLAGAAAWLAWYVPTAMLSGGFARLAAMTREQMVRSIAGTSIFFGAALAAHAHMVIDVCIYLTLALAGLAVPLAVSFAASRRAPLPSWATPLFFALWMAPNLAMVCLFHCPNPGYVVLSLPPLALMGAWLATPALSRAKWIAAVVGVGLLAGYFPYERFINPGVVTLPYVLLRASPHMAGLTESMQRELRAMIDSMPYRPAERLIFCLRQRSEAPNIRTVTCEYPDVAWADFAAPAGRLLDTVRVIGWLCDGGGLPRDVRARYPQARRLGGNELFSFWTVSVTSGT